MEDGAHPGLGEERLLALLEVGRGLVAELDLEKLLHDLLEVARELTGARYAALGVLDGRRERLERFLNVGLDDATRASIGTLPQGRGVLGLLIADPHPLRLADVGSHPDSYGFPAGHPPMHSFLGAPVVIRGESYGNLYLTDKRDGGAFDAADEQALVILADWAAIAIENARLYRDEHERRAELERTVSALETTTEIARAVGGETDLQRILALIAERGRALVSARAIVIELLDGEDLVIKAMAGPLDPALLDHRIALEGSLGGHVLDSRRAARLGEAPGGLPFQLAELVGARTGLVVPLVFRDRAVGVAAAFDRQSSGPDFTAQDERLMEAFAASAATAVVTAQTVEAQALARSVEASELERRRWARELHDDSLQELAAVKLRLGALAHVEPEALPGAVAQAVEQVDASIRAMRGLITDMRPASLDQLGVEPALAALVARSRDLSGLRIDLDVALGSDSRLAPEVETTVYRVVQEALTNVVKHAGARTVAVQVAERDGAVTVRVNDDGDGFVPGGETAGFGLIGMRERARLAGGELEVRSEPGGGTTVVASIPAPRGDTAATPDRNP